MPTNDDEQTPSADSFERHAGAPSPCGRCLADPDRRSFLAGMASALAVLALQGILPRSAHALPAREVHGVAEGRPDGAPQEISYPIPSTDGVEIDKKQGVIIARHAGMVYAFALSCPHQNTALRWNDGNSTFQCPRHKSRYQADGAFISGRATRAMDRFAVHRAGDQLRVNLDALYEQDTQAAAWGEAKVAL